MANSLEQLKATGTVSRVLPRQTKPLKCVELDEELQRARVVAILSGQTTRRLAHMASMAWDMLLTSHSKSGCCQRFWYVAPPPPPEVL